MYVLPKEFKQHIVRPDLKGQLTILLGHGNETKYAIENIKEFTTEFFPECVTVDMFSHIFKDVISSPQSFETRFKEILFNIENRYKNKKKIVLICDEFHMLGSFAMLHQSPAEYREIFRNFLKALPEHVIMIGVSTIEEYEHVTQLLLAPLEPRMTIFEIEEHFDIVISMVRQLKMTRLDKSITQEVLSKMSGVSQGTISRIEKMQMIPTIDTLIKMSDALGLELMFLDKEEMSARGSV